MDVIDMKPRLNTSRHHCYLSLRDEVEAVGFVSRRKDNASFSVVLLRAVPLTVTCITSHVADWYIAQNLEHLYGLFHFLYYSKASLLDYC